MIFAELLHFFLIFFVLFIKIQFKKYNMIFWPKMKLSPFPNSSKPYFKLYIISLEEQKLDFYLFLFFLNVHFKITDKS